MRACREVIACLAKGADLPLPFCYLQQGDFIEDDGEGATARFEMTAYVSRAVQLHPHGGQPDFVWLPARTPHGAYVW